MMMSEEDDFLLDRIASNDADAFGLLLERHYDRIFRIAFQVLGDKQAAEDVAQDVCISLSTKITSFDRQSKFTTWLYRIVKNASIDAVRKLKTRDRNNEAWASVTLMQSEAAQEYAEDLNWLNEIFSQLKDDLKVTVAFVVGEGLSHAAAAKILEVSEGTVSWRMSEVRKIATLMAQQEGRVS
jgi:RNA polymerase sigma-70 factor (ECF subfamily)